MKRRHDMMRAGRTESDNLEDETTPFCFIAHAAQTGRGRGLKFFMEVHLGTTTTGISNFHP